MTLEPLQLPLTHGPLYRLQKTVDKFSLSIHGPWSWKAWKWLLEAARLDNFLPSMTNALYVRYSASFASGETPDDFWQEVKDDTRVNGWRHLLFFSLSRIKIDAAVKD